jgi:DNA-binding cell septation regulator SpoVG
MNVYIEKFYSFEVDYRNYRVLGYVDVKLENAVRLKYIKVLQNKLDNSVFLQMPTCKDSKKPFFELLDSNITEYIKQNVIKILSENL